MPYIGNITQDFNVSNAMLDTDSVTSIKIVDGTIEGADIAANLDLSDSQKIRFGAGNDLQIYHDGSHSRIDDTGTGALIVSASKFQINNAASNEVQAFFLQNGASALYYDNSKKFETTSNGAIVTGSLGVDELYMGDNEQIKIGAEDDFLIYHGGAENVLDGVLHKIELRHGSEKHLVANPDGAVELYHNNSKKLETTSGGIDLPDQLQVDGTVFATGGLKINSDSNKLRLGAGDDLQLFHNGTLSTITNTAGTLRYLSSTHYFANPAVGELHAQFVENGRCELRFDNAIKIETTSIGVDITGTTTDDGARHDGDVYFIGATSGRNAVWDMSDNALEFADSTVASFGDSADFRIYHNGSDSVLQDQGTGSLLALSNTFHIKNAANNETLAKFIEDGAVELYHNNLLRFQTTTDGCQLQSNTTEAVFSLRSTAQDGAPVLQFLSDDFDDTADAWRLRADGGGTAFGIQNKASGSWENSIVANENGNVKLYYDNSVKLETTSSGLSFSGDTFMPDGEYAHFGTGNDMYIGHSGSLGSISNVTGNFEIYSNEYRLRSFTASNETMMQASLHGDANLWYDNVKRFETSSTGNQSTGVHKFITGNGSTAGDDNVLHIVAGGTADRGIKIGTGRAGGASQNDGMGFIDAINSESNGYGSQLQFRIDGTAVMSIGNQSNDWVGIGTTTPTARLSIADTGPAIVEVHHTDGAVGDESRIMLGALPNNPPNNRGAGIAAIRMSSGHDLALKTSSTDGAGPSEKLRVLAGGGLTFNGDTATNNALNDYEQGTWTPTAFYGSGSFSAVNNAVCRYVKVGNLVHISGRFSLTGGGSGELKIEGLPYAKGNPSADGNSAGIQIYLEGAASNITNDIVGLVIDATTQIFIRRSGTTSSGGDVAGLVDGGTTLLIGGTYSTFG